MQSVLLLSECNSCAKPIYSSSAHKRPHKQINHRSYPIVIMYEVLRSNSSVDVIRRIYYMYLLLLLSMIRRIVYCCTAVPPYHIYGMVP